MHAVPLNMRVWNRASMGVNDASAVAPDATSNGE
jgi:hypothetical protein